MQYQLADDIPSALPFHLFPTINRDASGRWEALAAPCVPRAGRHGGWGWVEKGLCMLSFTLCLFCSSCRLQVYLKLRCDLPPKR